MKPSTVNPVVPGGGTPLFNAGRERQLLDVLLFDLGAVVLTYKPN